MYTVKYAADGRLLASGSFDRTIRIWDGPHEVMCLRKHTLPVTQLLWSSEDHSSASILSAGLDRTCRLWDVRAGKVRDVYETQGIPQSIAFHHQDQHIFAYGGSKGIISIVDTRQNHTGTSEGSGDGSGGGGSNGGGGAGGGSGSRSWENPTGSVNALHFCRDGYGLLTGDAQGRVSLWDTRTGRWVKSMETDHHQGTPICHMSILHGHHANDPDHVAITGFDDLLGLYQGSCDLEGQQGLRPLHPLLPSGGYRNRCWPIQSTFFEGRDYTAPLLAQWKHQGSSGPGSNGSLLNGLGRGRHGQVGGAPGSSLGPLDEGGISGSEVTGNGTKSGRQDLGDVSKGWYGDRSRSTVPKKEPFQEDGEAEAGTKKEEEEEVEEEEEGTHARFRQLEPQKSLDTSLLLATGSSLPHVYLYDVGGAEGSVRVLQRLEGHRDRVYTVDFSPREPLLASGSADMSIRLWSPAQRARHKVDGEI